MTHADYERELSEDKDIRFLANSDPTFAQELYAALCNVTWKSEKYSIPFSMTWRYAGGVVADIVGRNEDYLDYYCSGSEGTVSQRVLTELTRIGWSFIHE